MNALQSHVLPASQHRDDPTFALQNTTARILQLLSPRLTQSVKSQPSLAANKETVAALISKLEARYAYLRHPENSPSPPPPSAVTVLGGSVTAGVNCHAGIPRIRNENCAWPGRLESFLNNLARVSLGRGVMDADADDDDTKLVQVHTLAVGGTNTATGQTILEYGILPDDADQPDILVNAYSTNDMHVLTLEQANDSGLTIRDLVFGMAQDFTRTVLKPCQQQRPLLVWLDDYLGNEQREILATQHLSQSISVLSNYYGFVFASYADTVRDLVYGDTTERMFSPAGWYRNNRMVREIHPGQGMHLSVAWILAFNLLSAVSTHCAAISVSELKVTDDIVLEEGSLNGKTLRQYFDEAQPPFPMPYPTNSLPPPLNADLTLDVVSSQWRRQALEAQKDCGNTESGGSSSKRCPVAWVSGMPWREESWIRDYFTGIVQEPLEWSVVDDTVRGGKFGWIPNNTTSIPKLVMEFNARKHEASQVQSIALFYMKSYGEKWSGSQVTVSVDAKRNQRYETAVSTTLSGVHNKTTSEMYTDRIALPPGRMDPSVLRLTLTLSGGTTFKLMGIAVCK